MPLSRYARHRKALAARALKACITILTWLRWETGVLEDPELLEKVDAQRRRLEKELSLLGSLFLTSGDHTSHVEPPQGRAG